MVILLLALLAASLVANAVLGWKLVAPSRPAAPPPPEKQLLAEKSSELLAAISRVTTDGFILVRSDNHRVEFVNDAAKSLLSLDDGVGKLLREIEFGTELQTLVEQAERQPPETLDQIIAKGDRTFSAHVQMVAAGAKDVVLIRLHEVTELQRLGRARRDFVANISHDLRTPVTSLQLLVDTMTEESSMDKSFALDLLGKMHLQIDLLRQLTDELMDLALIESGQAPIKLVETSAADLVRDAIGPLYPQADQKRLRITVTVPPDLLVLADPEAIRKVIRNLAHNAIKFTAAEGLVEIEAARDGDNVRFSVSDTGMGIPAKDLPRVFERFYKVDRARARGAGELRGTGLGLAIAKHIVSGHGGEIWADSVEGEGSTFFFTLPAAG